MTGEHVFVTHARADLELTQDLFSTAKNFPFGVHLALEEVDQGRARERLMGRIANSDVAVAVLTESSVDDRWLNQEVGYALASGVPVVPLYERADLREGYLADVDGVELRRENLARTIFDLLGRLRSHLAPLGALSVPDWFVRFPCTVPGCDHPVTLEIDHDQSKLWKLRGHGTLLETTCERCEAQYYFDPATIGFVRREQSARSRGP